ncbi:hypothetical protein QMO14_07880 [Variovorax sp. CAN2819]|uniref:hypothetical protein n=1 Tax=Variovorax sp. CAN15 TaxID=3046727 RepID=UPI00264A3BE4|nr:hypothetical protein [Variovorax sp. CAN15]MDN6883515.1 hypothetical protein [Variovorax sp. CAN15]
MSVSTHLQLLNHALAGEKRKLMIRDPCHLVLSKLDTPGPTGLLLSLRSTNVILGTDSDSGHFLVKLVDVANGKTTTRLSLSVGEWLEAVAWRSHFQQLQMRCAAQQAPTPRGSPGR